MARGTWPTWTSSPNKAGARGEAVRLGIPARRELAAGRLRRVTSPEYLESLAGALGADPSVVADG